MTSQWLQHVVDLAGQTWMLSIINWTIVTGKILYLRRSTVSFHIDHPLLCAQQCSRMLHRTGLSVSDSRYFVQWW